MKNIHQLLGIWLYCQTELEKTLRWSKYVQYKKNGKPARYNGIRRQNVTEHTLSKLFAFSMILPKLKKVFGKGVDFDLLWTCIMVHDFGEGLRGKKYDILANNKTDNDDLEEYLLVMDLLNKSGLQDRGMKFNFEKAFLLQFALTSYKIFPLKAQEVMEDIRQNRIEKDTAIIFQIMEKWEYLFYACEHQKKHPTIFRDVSLRNIPMVRGWILQFEKKYHKPLTKIFVD